MKTCGADMAEGRLETMMPILRFTGHPLADVGVATLCAMTGKKTPDALTLADLDEVADELRKDYFTGLMTSYLAVVFPNSGYINPTMGADKRRAYETRILRAHRWAGDPEATGLSCAYSDQPATHLVHRSHVPMLTGEEVLNFFPAGRGALPLSGPYLLAVQAVPMGGRRAEGKLLVAHSDNAELTIAFAKKYVADNRRLRHLARQRKLPARNGPDPSLEREHAAKDGDQPKYPDAKGPMSLVAKDLLDIALDAGVHSGEASVTVYVMSNSGQGRPSTEIHPIPSELVRFLLSVQRSEAARSWGDLVARSWREPKEARDDDLATADGAREDEGKKPRRRTTKPTKATAAVVPGGPGRSRNGALDDLFAIFEGGFTDRGAAGRFVRRHLLRDVQYSRWIRPGERRRAAAIEDPTLVDWQLAGFFLKEVVSMDAKRVERIRDFADQLAGHVATTNDRGLFRDLVFARRAWEMRNALAKAQRDEAREHDRLLFTLQDYLDVFEADDAVGATDWSLVRDLVSIRLVESLQARGFFSERTDWLAEPEAREDSGG